MWKLYCEETCELKNWCFWTVVLEKTLESPLDCKEIQSVHSEGDLPWISLEGLMLKLKLSTLATSCEELTHWKILWCWEGLGAGGEGDDRGWGGWMASLTRWTWVWVNSSSWLWTGRPGVLQFMGSQRVGHNWVTELNWLHYSLYTDSFFISSRSLLKLSCIFSILVSRLFICDSIFISRFWIIFTIIFRILYQVYSLSLPLLFGLLGIYPVPLPAGYSSVSSSCLYCCVWGGLSVFWQFVEFSLL